MTLILAIETSCDETAAAVIEDGTIIRANIVASQIDIHRQYGGVFPEVASRLHVETISGVVAAALAQNGTSPAALDALAVTHGPGLAGSLLVGVNFAKGLAFGWGKPLLPINHLEGHLYSLWLTEHAPTFRFPLLCLIVSGGHTDVILMHGHGDYTRLGRTLDDAAGEAFDKVGRVLNLPYPGGPAIEKAAREGDPTRYPFTRSVLGADHPYDFSFSGLKTAVMRAVQPPPASGKRIRGEESMSSGALRPEVSIPDMAASFQAAAVSMLVEKMAAAARDHAATAILLSGGVSANTALREAMRAESALPVYYPPLALCTDNAAMIGAAAHQHYLRGARGDFRFDVQPMAGLG